jgi:hypothetical protein
MNEQTLYVSQRSFLSSSAMQQSTSSSSLGMEVHELTLEAPLHHCVRCHASFTFAQLTRTQLEDAIAANPGQLRWMQAWISLLDAAEPSLAASTLTGTDAEDMADRIPVEAYASNPANGNQSIEEQMDRDDLRNMRAQLRALCADLLPMAQELLMPLAEGTMEDVLLLDLMFELRDRLAQNYSEGTTAALCRAATCADGILGQAQCHAFVTFETINVSTHTIDEHFSVHTRRVHEESVEQQSFGFCHRRQSRVSHQEERHLEYTNQRLRDIVVKIPVYVCAFCAATSSCNTEQWRRTNPWESEHMRAAAALLRSVFEIGVAEEARSAASPGVGATLATSTQTEDSGATAEHVSEGDEALERRIRQREENAAVSRNNTGRAFPGTETAMSRCSDRSDGRPLYPDTENVGADVLRAAIPRGLPEVLVESDSEAALTRLALLRHREAELQGQIQRLAWDEPAAQVAERPPRSLNDDQSPLRPHTDHIDACIAELGQIHADILALQRDEQEQIDSDAIIASLLAADEDETDEQRRRDSELASRTAAEMEDEQLRRDVELARRLAGEEADMQAAVALQRDEREQIDSDFELASRTAAEMEDEQLRRDVELARHLAGEAEERPQSPQP